MRQAADEYSAMRAQRRWGDDTQPSTLGPSQKEELYHHREGHSHTLAVRAPALW
jgi:hypothetical protein